MKAKAMTDALYRIELPNGCYWLQRDGVKYGDIFTETGGYVMASVHRNRAIAMANCFGSRATPPSPALTQTAEEVAERCANEFRFSKDEETALAACRVIIRLAIDHELAAEKAHADMLADELWEAQRKLSAKPRYTNHQISMGIARGIAAHAKRREG